MDVQRWRSALVAWLSLVAVAHVIVGLMVFFLSDRPWADEYHRTVTTAFWPKGPFLEAVRLEQVWWMSLFGATFQCLGIWMLALVRYAGRHHIAGIWLWLAAGLVVWAPQDMYLSWQAGVGIHLGADSLALITVLPATLLLWRWDRVPR